MPLDPAPAPDELADQSDAMIKRLAGPHASIREDQLAAITALMQGHRVLVVQRTGWGKTAVYLIATALTRQRQTTGRRGPTLLVSPLLALMRDQLAAAASLGVRAATINSANIDQWKQVEQDIADDVVDLLLISPERLNHPGFRDRVWPTLQGRVGLVVIDEAHCISDWGHDFRPDYRRIAEVLDDLVVDSRGSGQDVAVLATTATANDRVVADIEAQLGQDPRTIRGGLERQSLRLAVHRLDDAQRLAWLAQWIPGTSGSGIVYCLTVADTQMVAEFLNEQGIDAQAYSGALDSDARERLERDLKQDRVKVVIATSALGMGFDKPDLTFVIHHGLPSSPVAYYQAIGRAGRAVDSADVVALPGRHDGDVWRYFQSASMPRQSLVDSILRTLGTDQPTSLPALEQQVNAGRSRLDAALRILDVDGVVARTTGGWIATGQGWAPDEARLDRVASARTVEADAMRIYQQAEECLMQQLLIHLDDPLVDDAWTCGRCMVCDPSLASARMFPSPEHVQQAHRFLRSRDVEIQPRRMWPSGMPGRRGRIKAPHQAQPGRALARGKDPGWHDVVKPLLATGARREDPDVEEAFQQAVEGLIGVLARWDWPSRPTWITFVPSRRRAWLPRDLAQAIGGKGRLPVIPSLVVGQGRRLPQSSMDNSVHAALNATKAFTVDDQAVAGAPAGPTLLLDDTRVSGWTLTVAADELGQRGVPAVLPLVLQLAY